MWPSSRLVTAERDGYFAICPSPRPNPRDDEVYIREQPLQTGACKSSQENKVSIVCSAERKFLSAERQVYGTPVAPSTGFAIDELLTGRNADRTLGQELTDGDLRRLLARHSRIR